MRGEVERTCLQISQESRHSSGLGLVSSPGAHTLAAMSAAELAAKVAAAAEVEAVKPQEAAKLLREVIFADASSDNESVKVKEQGIDKLSKLLGKLKDAPGLKALLSELRPLFAVGPGEYPSSRHSIEGGGKGRLRRRRWRWRGTTVGGRAT